MNRIDPAGQQQSKGEALSLRMSSVTAGSGTTRIEMKEWLNPGRVSDHAEWI